MSGSLSLMELNIIRIGWVLFGACDHATRSPRDYCIVELNLEFKSKMLDDYFEMNSCQLSNCDVRQ